MYSFSYLEPVYCSTSSSNCCFWNCIQVSQGAGQVVSYSHLFQNLFWWCQYAECHFLMRTWNIEMTKKVVRVFVTSYGKTWMNFLANPYVTLTISGNDKVIREEWWKYEYTGMTQRDGMGREEGSGWGTHVYLWQIHFDIWQNQYNILKLNKIKFKKCAFSKKRKYEYSYS